MNIPPFPAHDLAKLVLGYLAEEQLMTAYDEFLSASPYLDAMKNEYDRIFMTSLKNVLAEYRAVKIYVETCKPYALRRRLFGCSNLLEIVKLLVQNVDINKLHSPEGNRGSSEGRNSCAVCLSLNLPCCECKSRHSLSSANTQLNIDTNSHETSVEATPLEDLPGNHVTNRKKHVKTLPKDGRVSQSESNSDVNIENNFTSNFEHTLPNNSQSLQTRLQTSSIHAYSDVVMGSSIPGPNMNQINEYNNNTPVHHRSNINCTENVTAQRISMAGTFQDFTTGVQGGENINSNVPDSSTSENFSIHSSSTKEICIPGSTNSAKSVSKAHIFLTVGTIKTTASPQTADENSGTKLPCNTSHPKSKPTESKVTILSDIKVDKTFNNDPNMPAVLKNATSTPLMHMQTILINGTPVYKPQPAVMGPNRNFTKDEIMAMPTIIVVPTSGASQNPPNELTEIPPQPSNPPTSIISSTAPPLEPLLIDVPTNSPALPHNTTVINNMPLLDQQKSAEKEMLVKTVDTKMVSAPRDGGEPSFKNTPQVLPPLRKSSSTPRRNSHVRVLDFATPRRILQEQINENVAENEAPVEVVISRSPNLHTLADPATDYTIVKDNSKTNKAADSTANSSGSSKENEKMVKTVPVKKHNWDADLRAIAIVNKKEDIPKSCIQPRCRPRAKTNKTKLSLDKKTKEKKVSKNTKESINKNKNVNCSRKSNEIAEEPIIVVDDKSNIPVKPTINIITGQDWSVQENDKNVNNKSNDNDPTDTPEMDRLSLQNEIGVKLNISEFLETPYKQVLYDIQMETPRFLGPDLPGEPMSDIKIMNIPTPRFLETPKPVQATPSSYSSRPTDYSSGGSYYKPDDQDYISVGDLGYPAVEHTEKENEDTKNADEGKNEQKNKSKLVTKSRPVRKCAKNVSYYKSPQATKTKESDKVEKVAISSDIVGSNSLTENKDENESGCKSAKDGKPKTKRISTSKKHKSPLKREPPKTFMKIKPRRVTPTKESIKGKVRSRKSEVQPRKRTTSKETSDAMPVVVPVPTKSRRKSSTPRKLHCTKNFTSESSGHDSPDMTPKAKNDREVPLSVQDSDTEQVQLHWSDDGSQDTKASEQPRNISTNEAEDISKIKEYIDSELQSSNTVGKSNERSSNLHADLIKRGFDVETAKIIERDLLDSPRPNPEEVNPAGSQPVATINTNKDKEQFEKTLDSDTSTNLKIVQDEESECGEYDLGVAECHEESEHYITCNHDDLKDMPRAPAITLKDKYSMEICMEDITVRVSATPITTVLDQDPVELVDYNEKETEMAVNSISDIDKLYTPRKDPDIRAQVYNIFESTLTSLDTPLKATSPKRKECDTTVTEIILEVEKVEDREKPEDKRRKRLHSVESNDSASSSKRPKPEAQYLLNSANIQNIDIETVLSKLHGP